MWSWSALNTALLHSPAIRASAFHVADVYKRTIETLWPLVSPDGRHCGHQAHHMSLSFIFQLPALIKVVLLAFSSACFDNKRCIKRAEHSYPYLIKGNSWLVLSGISFNCCVVKPHMSCKIRVHFSNGAWPFHVLVTALTFNRPFYQYGSHRLDLRSINYCIPKGHSLSIYVQFWAKRELHCIFLGKKAIIINFLHLNTAQLSFFPIFV